MIPGYATSACCTKATLLTDPTLTYTKRLYLSRIPMTLRKNTNPSIPVHVLKRQFALRSICCYVVVQNHRNFPTKTVNEEVSQFIQNSVLETVQVQRGCKDILCILNKVQIRLSEMKILWWCLGIIHPILQGHAALQAINGVWLLHFYICMSDLNDKLRKTPT